MRSFFRSKGGFLRLYIVRHAEAEERAPGTREVDRALTSRGMKQAKSLGDILRKTDSPSRTTPELLLSSPAARALQTATLIGAPIRTPPRIEPRLGLDSGVDQILELVRGLCDHGITSLMIVGHNPTLEDLAAKLGAGVGLKKAETVSVEVDFKGKSVVTSHIERFRAEG